MSTTADRLSFTCSSQVSTTNGQPISLENGNESNVNEKSGIKRANSLSVANVSDSDHSLSDIASTNGCCIDATKIPLPWINKSERNHTKSVNSNGNEQLMKIIVNVLVCFL